MRANILSTNLSRFEKITLIINIIIITYPNTHKKGERIIDSDLSGVLCICVIILWVFGQLF